MATHVKVLGILHLVWGGLMVLAGVICVVVFGGIAGIVGASADQPDERAVAIPVLGGIGLIILIVLAVLAIPSLLAGIGLLKFQNWARILTIVLSCIHLLNIPIGTALGAYGLWALLSPQTEALFRHPGYPQTA